jgi:hypothetical protein
MCMHYTCLCRLEGADATWSCCAQLGQCNLGLDVMQLGLAVRMCTCAHTHWLEEIHCIMRTCLAYMRLKETVSRNRMKKLTKRVYLLIGANSGGETNEGETSAEARTVSPSLDASPGVHMRVCIFILYMYISPSPPGVHMCVRIYVYIYITSLDASPGMHICVYIFIYIYIYIFMYIS